MSYKEAALRNRQLIYNLICNCLKILSRFLHLLFSGKKLCCKSFQPDLNYCIDGTINQLRWNVQNAIYITISNSSQVFFNSGQLLFQVKQEQSEIQLTAYGVGKKEKLLTKIKVANLQKDDFSNIKIQKKDVELESKKIEKRLKKHPSPIYTLNRKPISPFNKADIQIENSIYLNNTSSKISQISTFKDLEKLKALLEKDSY